MALSGPLADLLRKAKDGDSYWIESAKLDLSVELERLRTAKGLSYAELARRLGSSAAYVSKIFRGDANLTIETVVKLARAMDGHIRISAVWEVEDTGSKWASAIRQVASSTPTVSIVGNVTPSSSSKTVVSAGVSCPAEAA
ncbi:MAG: helix-turn-helix transcriptional regulator [Rhodocyclaceae bacterium]|nr:helix-turn-helix transcriptional regulator [Rhodocyclaceae bacterium]